MKRSAASGELATFANMRFTRPAILRYPSGRFGIVGAIPHQLTVPQTQGTPQIPPARQSMSWATEQEAIDALIAIGITEFQLADCSWYGRTS